MKEWMIQFYEKPEKKKAKILFLIYFCSGLWFLTFGENPLTEDPFVGYIYVIGGTLNTITMVPFLIGVFPFLPILFQRYGFLSYFLILLFTGHFFIFIFFIRWWPIYIPFFLGLLFGIYMYITIRTYKKEQVL